MSRTWLEADGRRFPMMSIAGGISVQFALHGPGYTASIFLMGPSPASGIRIATIEMDANDLFFLRWTSGGLTRLGGLARVFQRSNEILLIWRDDDDCLIQQESFPIRIAV